jgi:hypothetical protein
MAQYAHYIVENGVQIHTPVTGIFRVCALRPLIGAALLHHIDGDFASLNQEDNFYARYMGDFVLLTRTRWQLRRGIVRLADYFDAGGFERHPDKTQTGRNGTASAGWVSGSGLRGRHRAPGTEQPSRTARAAL